MLQKVMFYYLYIFIETDLICKKSTLQRSCCKLLFVAELQIMKMFHTVPQQNSY